MSYTYKDKYGISHTVSSESTAKQYAAGGYSGSGGNSSYAKPAVSRPKIPTWQDNLNKYKTDTNAGNAETERAGQVYTQKTAAGDTAGAEAAHRWANQVRDAMGVSSQYGSTTGAKLGTVQSTAQSTPTAQGITSQQYGIPQVTPTTQTPAQGAQQYSVPYESLLRDLINQSSTYKAPTESELLSQAQQYAQLQVDPVLSAIQSRLANTQTNYGNEKAATEAAYAGVPARTQSLLDEARRSALESAISRGMGRSGVVDWQTEKLSTPIMQQATQSEQEKAAKLAAIANTLATSQSEAGRQQQEAESRRGTLESSRLADLRQMAQQLAAQGQESKWNQGYQLANLANSANQAEYSNALREALLRMGGV